MLRFRNNLQLPKISRACSPGANNTFKKIDELERKMKNLEEENVKLKQGNQKLELKVEILQDNIKSINRTFGLPRSPGDKAKY